MSLFFVGALRHQRDGEPSTANQQKSEHAKGVPIIWTCCEKKAPPHIQNGVLFNMRRFFLFYVLSADRELKSVV